MALPQYDDKQQTQQQPATRPEKAPRVKLTAACEPCRKRKGRCSRHIPCDFCVKHSIRCEFNYNRQRRGPRCRKQNREPAIQRPLRPFSAAVQSIEHAPPQVAPAMPTEEVRELEELQDDEDDNDDNEDEENEDDEDDENYEEAEDNTLLRDTITMILDSDEHDPSGWRPPVELILHLLAVFETHGLKHSCWIWIWGPGSFLQQLAQEGCSRAMLFSICATSFKFSRHRSILFKTRAASHQQFAATARRCLIAAPDRNGVLDRVQCLCVLARYEMGESNGLQAWCDISTAFTLIRVARADEAHTATNQGAMNRLLMCLQVTERELCLGHNLEPSADSIHHALALSSDPYETHSATQITAILDLMLSIERYSKGPYTAPLTPLWSVDSEFMNHRQALDKYLVQNLPRLQFASEELLQDDDEIGKKLDDLYCALAWHCSVVLLNRVFLPRIVSRQPHRDSSRESPLPLDSTDFPSVPKGFLAEQIVSCESSALSICDICSNVLDCDSFLISPFIGYCCFQSSIVLINQLRRTKAADSKIAEQLKINLTILSVIRKFHKPAHAWLETIFKIHRYNNSVPTAASSAVDMFATFFSRFENIREPAFVPLKPSTIIPSPVLSRPISSSPRQVLDNESREKGPHASETSDLNKAIQRAQLIEEYKSRLQSHILDIDDGQVTRKSSQHSVVRDENIVPIQSPFQQEDNQDMNAPAHQNEFNATTTMPSEMDMSGLHSSPQQAMTLATTTIDTQKPAELDPHMTHDSMSMMDAMAGLDYSSTEAFDFLPFIDLDDRQLQSFPAYPFTSNLESMLSASAERNLWL
ncbi:uncharacterized protein K460DRAFT_368549 [Cucurbitaria berberidis CBS 394.84]|uniref:Zn(2)-C6 fungal-type domain-containing protein n=1 Tax=Cucurbitaria berberidis CBS 394.84 TaxID=1168544 RepID=A0A9P4GD32_9PLEO|nr:uncharacterized protein K460DRAFT_368549 [Cucurbitaria berberidis CBS 394.84]KAF1843688.1 hypothetical protein K460DRAFT_368549 [Cucurbitaria berberidis CBS 394.84]